MSENKLVTLTSLSERYYRPLVFILSGLLLFGSGMFLAKAWQVRNPPPIRYEVGELSEGTTETSESEAGSSGNEEILIKVDVSGAVKDPKVCELVEGSRVEDALEQSGGLSDAADGEWVSRELNLATKLSDGDKLYIPRKGKIAGEAVVGSPAGAQLSVGRGVISAESQELSVSGKVNINTAPQLELESLTGIGPVKAQAIVVYRSSNPFDSIEGIMEVKGIGSGTFEKIKDRITVK